MTASSYYRLALGVAIATTLFLLFGMGALGIIGAGGRPDLLYLTALGVGAVGAVVARFRPRGMALALAATALTVVLVALVALASGLHRTEGASAVDIVAVSGMYAVLFAVAAWLFRRSAERQRESR